MHTFTLSTLPLSLKNYMS